MIRFEILLPLFYNDGRRIERHKFVLSDDQLVNAFGATSTDTVIVSGRWVYDSTKFSFASTSRTLPRTGRKCATQRSC
jgi:hypothetical protein